MNKYRGPIQFIRFLHSVKRFGIHLHRQRHDKADFCIEELKSRKVIRVSGEDSADFLQGLITNDISSLTSSMYTMFLNNKGRVLFDSIVYRSKERNTFLLECDSEALPSMIKHLNIYKLRRKVDISSLDSELDVWCVYNPKYIDSVIDKTSNEQMKSVVEPFETSGICSEDALVVPDPRTSLLGYRLVVRKKEQVPDLPESDLYQSFRYKLGIGEGVDELLVGQSFPLEMNCDYLQGVSFNKGCYIGQELTARTFHTGVIRKRLMPLQFDSEPLGIPVNSSVEDMTISRKSPIGKLRAAKGVYGIALLRVAETLESSSLKIINVTARSYLPVWWPDEAVQQSYVKIKK